MQLPLTRFGHDTKSMDKRRARRTARAKWVCCPGLVLCPEKLLTFLLPPPPPPPPPPPSRALGRGRLQGIIRSVRPFGAFVDVGSTTDGLLHISNMLPAHRQYFGNELVVTASEGEQVLVEVTQVNLKTRKFNLREVEIVQSARTRPSVPGPGAQSQGKTPAAMDPELDELYDAVLTGDEDVADEERRLRARRKEGAALEKWANKMRNKGQWRQVTHALVNSVTEFGAFVELGGREGLLHVSEMTGTAVSRGGKVLLRQGDKIQVRVLAVDSAAQQIKFSMKPWQPSPEEEEAELRREAVSKGVPLPTSARPTAASALETARARAGASEEKAGPGLAGVGGDADAPKSAFAAAWEKALKDAS